MTYVSTAAANVCGRHALAFGALGIAAAFAGVAFKALFPLIAAAALLGGAVGAWILRARFQPSEGAIR